MSRYVFALLIAVVAGQACGARAAEPALESLKQTYETEVRKIRSEHEEKVAKLLAAYGKSLDKAVAMAKRWQNWGRL